MFRLTERVFLALLARAESALSCLFPMTMAIGQILKIEHI